MKLENWRHGRESSQKQSITEVSRIISRNRLCKPPPEGELFAIIVFALIFRFVPDGYRRKRNQFLIRFAETLFKFTKHSYEICSRWCCAIAVTVGHRGLIETLYNLGLM